MILEKILDNDMCYAEHREGTGTFRIRKDEKQGEKDELVKIMNEFDKK